MMQAHVGEIAYRGAGDSIVVVVDLAGIDQGTALPRHARQKMRRHSEVGSRLEIIVEYDTTIDFAKNEGPHPLSIEKVGFAGDSRPDAPRKYGRLRKGFR